MKLRYRTKRLVYTAIVIAVAVAVSLLTTVVSPRLVFATPNSATLDYFYQIEAYNYDPSASQCDTSRDAASSDPGTGEATAGLSAAQVAFAEKYHSIAEDLSVAYGIPWETVVAQGILESASGTTCLAIKKHNYFGIGAYDSCADTCECAKSYPSAEAGWEGYYENIQGTPTYRNHGVFQGNTITDPIAYLNAIKKAGYATDPDYVTKVSKIIYAIEDLADQKGWMNSAELAQQKPAMFTNAQKNAAGTGAVAISFGDSDDDEESEINTCIDPSIDGLSDYDGSGFPWYNQCDSTWGSETYGGFGSICSSGCGPTSFAMLATALSGKSITPSATTQIAGAAGMHVQGAGSSWQITKVLADKYGFQYKDLGASSKSQAISKINQALKDGWMIHTSGKGSNPFSSGGHYIGIRGITSDGKWLIADSNGSKGKENTLNKAFSPEAVVNAGMHISNIKAIK